MKKELKILLVLAGVVVIGFFAFAQFYKKAEAPTPATTSQNSTPQSEASLPSTSPQGLPEGLKAPVSVDERLVRPDSPAQGPENARVILVEFLDPECESCRAFYPEVKKILKEYEGQIRFVVRYMTFHSNSALAAMATEAAGSQGKYWEMQEILFNKQPEWSHKQDPQKELMIKYAQELGLNTEKFSASLSNLMVLQKLERDKEDGVALGVTGTPTLFVNGKKLEGLGYDELKSQIELQLQTAK